MRNILLYPKTVPFTTRRYQPHRGAFWYPPVACQRLLAVAAIVLLIGLPRASAQISTVVFSDDFSSNIIDTNKYQPDAPFFEGATGDIHAFNDPSFDDGGLHHMKLVADGKTVKLYLDNQLGTEVKFPFTTVVLEFGSYARADNDTADTTWDNLRVETVRQSTVVFSDDFSSNTIDPNKYQPDAPFFE